MPKYLVQDKNKTIRATGVRIFLIIIIKDDGMKKLTKWLTRGLAVLVILTLVIESSWMKVWCASVFLKLGGYDLFTSLVKSFHIIRRFLNL